MTIADWGSLGELGGSIGVMVTLIFLVVQMRQNTFALKSANLESVLSGYAALNREYFGTSTQSAENRAVWVRGHARFEGLTDDERHLFHHMMVDYVFHLQNVMQLRDRGTLDEVDFEAWNVHVVGAVSSTGGLVWWETMAAHFTATIREHLDRELTKLGHPTNTRLPRNPVDWIRDTPWLGQSSPLDAD
jgi:hypothetical protein